MIGSMTGRLVSPVLIGRGPEVATTDRALDAALAGRPVHLLIAGEAGVGKSRLVGELVRSAGERGMLVARGSCANFGDGGLPYGAIVEALRDVARSVDPEKLAAAVGPSGADLARLVPALAPAVRSDAGVPQEWLQVRLFEALLGLLQRLSSSAPLLLVIEDLHWADAATRDTIAFLVRNVRTERMLVAMTFRSDELHRRHPLLPWLAELERTGGIERVDLHRLDLDETRHLVAAIVGSDAAAELVERIHRRSDGNPFFVEELLASNPEAAGAERMPPTLREVLLARIASVPEATQMILGVAAVAGRRVDHDLLESIAGLPDATLHEALSAAVGSQLLVTETEGPGDEGYAFRHALLQEVAYDDLLPGERKRLHRACATALATRGVGDGAAAAAHWAELAHHWSAAHDARAALHASARAAEAAEQTFAFLAARTHYDRALELWSEVPDAESLTAMDRAGLLGRAATAAFLNGDGRREVALRREAIVEVDPVTDPVRASVLHERLGRALWNFGDTDASLKAYELAVALMPLDPPTTERARVLSGFGQMLMLLDRWRDSQRVCEEAIAIARQVDAPEAEGHALNTLGLDLTALGRSDDGVAALERALQIALEARNVDDIGRAYINLADALFFGGNVARAAEVVDEGVRVADAFGIATSYGSVIGQTGILILYDLGRWERAARLAAESRASSRVAPQTDRYGLSRWVNLLVSTGSIEAPELLESLRELIHEGPVESQFTAPYYGALAELARWDGRPADALETIERGLADMAGKDTWYWHLLRLHRVGAGAAADLAEVGRARRDVATEEDAIRRGSALGEARGRIVTASLTLQTGFAADESLAEAATAAAEETRLLGAPDPAAWREALTRWRARGRPYLVSYVRWREAEACLAVGERSDAVEALSEARQIAAGLGAGPLLEAIGSLADRSRLRLSHDDVVDAGDIVERTKEPPTIAPDPFGLTEREREVLALVALGRTNRQIGETLYISGNTAGVHVSNILGKLGASSRAEAAGIAVRLGLAGASER
jgi:DNA-binding CsgD family transcriptional regulator/tetratricopeptide (TPR) repeat protein